MNWETVKIGDLCEITSSKRIFYSEYVDSGVPFYRSKEIIEKTQGQSISEPLYILEEKYSEIKDKFGVPVAGDMLLTSVGTIGIPYIVKPNDYFYFKDGNLTWFRNFDKKLASSFLYYWIGSKEGFGILNNTTIGSSQKALTISALKQIEIPLPPVEKQRIIVGALSAYDDLIENNQKQIKLLEEAAQRLYKEWFVDLRFPGYETTPVEDGVPEGWHIGTLGEIVEYHDKKRKPLSSLERENFQGKYRYFGAAGVLDHVQDYLFDGTYLLLGEDGTVINNDGSPVLQYVNGKFWVNNHAHVLTGKGAFTTEYIYMMFQNTKVSDVVTGVAQPKISQARLSAKKVLIPDNKLVYCYSERITSMMEKTLLLQSQIDNLKETRDRLLPKLMSGEIEV